MIITNIFHRIAFKQNRKKMSIAGAFKVGEDANKLVRGVIQRL